MELPQVNYLYLGPELLLTVAALALLLIDLLIWPGQSRKMAGLSVIALLATGALTLNLMGVDGKTLGDLFIVDSFSIFFKMIFLVAAVMVVMLSSDYLTKHRLGSIGEYYVIILFATVGMMFMAATSDLVMIYLGLELTSISCYIAVGYHKNDPRSNEATLKYFLLGLIASAVMLYGFSLIYGFTGETELSRIAASLKGQTATMAVVAGLALAVAGFGFKVAAVPFHQWVPDVYEGAPTPVTAFLSVGPKAAAFAALSRVLFIGFPTFIVYWKVLFIGMSIASMFIGNLLAIPQTNIKRMLGYSSISHAGFILMGFAVATNEAMIGVLTYVAVYVLMNIGAFAVVMAVGHEEGGGEELTNFCGLSKRSPFLAATMTIFMIALAGMPPTAGLWAKLYVLKAAVSSNLWWLALIGLINSVVSLYYYTNVIRHMYLFEPKLNGPLATPVAFKAVVWAAVIGVLMIGVVPQPLLQLTKISLRGLG